MDNCDSDDNTDVSSANEHANDELSEQDDMEVVKTGETDNKSINIAATTVESENKDISDHDVNNEKKTDVNIEATVNLQVENDKTEAAKENIEKAMVDIKTMKEIHTFDTQYCLVQITRISLGNIIFRKSLIPQDFFNMASRPIIIR